MNQDSLFSNPRRGLWLNLALLFAVIGLGLSIYSTHHHLELKKLGATNAACNINDTFSCDAVARSAYSEVFGLPLGVWGMGYFAALLVLLGSWFLRRKSAEENIQTYSILVGVGFVVSVVLGTLSFFKIGAACLVCMGIYAITTLQGIFLLIYRLEIPGTFSLKGLFNGASTAVIIVALVAFGFNNFGAQLFNSAPTKPQSTTASSDLNNGTATPSASKDLPALTPNKQEIPISKSAYAGLGEDYRYGNDNAKIVVVEFADIQCPACQLVAMSISQLKQEFGDRVLFVFRNFPLDQACNSSIHSKMHEHACNLATIARCAGQYGKFWEYHDLAYREQASGANGKPEAWGRQIGLSDAQITACKASPDILNKIKDDIRLGDQLGVNSTPTLYMNGYKYVGDRTIQGIRTELEDLLRSSN